MSNFKEIRKPEQKSTSVARQLLSAINAGVHQRGDKLPPERVLAQQMKVSRNCVREALSALSVVGVIESKVGDGTYVSHAMGKEVNLEGYLIRTEKNEDVFDLWEARQNIESAIVKMAAEYASKKTVNRLRYLLDRMHEAVKLGEPLGYIQLDKGFHQAIAKASENLLLQRIVFPLIDISNDYLVDNMEDDRLLQRCQQSLPEHEAIFRAITSSDQEAAVAAMHVHFANVEKCFGRRRWCP